MLVNLDSYNPSLENLSFSNHYTETEDAIYVDGVTSSGIYNHGFGSSKKPTIVTNFTFGDKVYNFTLPAGEKRMFWGSRDANDKAKQQLIMDKHMTKKHLMNLYNSKYVTELKDKLIVDGVTQGIFSPFGDSSKGVEVRNFRDENGKIHTFPVFVGQQVFYEGLLSKGKNLMNLADSYMKNFDSYGRVDFQGGGQGMHTIDNMRGNAGSQTVFSI